MRRWIRGRLEEHDSLHFERCYYRLIECAIAKGHSRFEADAQGTQKIERGLVASPLHRDLGRQGGAGGPDGAGGGMP